MESSSDFQFIKESLIAAARGPFFPDWEFSTLFGLERVEVEAIADSLTPESALVGDVARAINGSMGNLLGYPHGQDAAWSQWLSITEPELHSVFQRWRARRSEA